MWKIGEMIGDREGRMDACIAAAGILKAHTDCLTYPAKQFRDVRGHYSHMCILNIILISPQVLEINTTGVLFTAQAAGQQMERFGNGDCAVGCFPIQAVHSNNDHVAQR